MYDEAQLDADVIAAVRKVWKDDGAPLLLSQLGLSRLSEAAKGFVSEHRISLKRYSRLRLANVLRFVPMPQQGGGLAPLVETKGMTDAELERRFKEAAASNLSRRRRIRFERSVWLAFRDPLPEGSRRAIDLSVVPLAVRQLGPEDELQLGEIPVEAHDTAIADEPELEPSAAAIERAIGSWCELKGVKLAQLTAVQQPRQPAGVVPQPAPTRTQVVGPTYGTSAGFVDVLRSIPSEQLARISVPGDVLLSVLEHLSKP